MPTQADRLTQSLQTLDFLEMQEISGSAMPAEYRNV